MQCADVLHRIVTLEVVQELPPDGEGPAADVHFRFTGGENLLLALDEEALDMPGIVRRSDRRNGACFGDIVRGGEHRSATETVADEELRRSVVLAQIICRCDEIAYVRAEGRFGKIAAAHAKSGEVEAQHCDATRGERLADVGGRLTLLGAREAVRKERIGPRLGG